MDRFPLASNLPWRSPFTPLSRLFYQYAPSFSRCLLHPAPEGFSDTFSYQFLLYNDAMARHVIIQPDLSRDELETRYRKARDAVEKSHWQLLWLLAQGKSTRQVAEVTGYCLNWIHILVRRYNQQGPAAIIDQRHRNPGAAPVLSVEQQAQLMQALDA